MLSPPHQNTPQHVSSRFSVCHVIDFKALSVSILTCREICFSEVIFVPQSQILKSAKRLSRSNVENEANKVKSKTRESKEENKKKNVNGNPDLG